MSNSTSDLIVNLNLAVFWINRIIPPFQIVFGTFGNLLNIIIFTSRRLRTNPCSLYFLAGSIVNLWALYVTLLISYLSNSWNIDPSATNTVLCKLRFFFAYISLNLVLWFTALASVDRFFSTSDHLWLRRLSNLSKARKIIIFTAIFIALIYVHTLFFYQANVSGNITSCGIFSSGYTIFFYFFLTTVSNILPITLMIFFGILTISNVRNVRNRVLPQGNNARNERLRSNDRQMILMLLIQVLVIIFNTIPYTISSLYNTVTIAVLKQQRSPLDQTLYRLLDSLFRSFFYSNPVVGFYIYTLAGSKFRAEMKHFIRFGVRTVLTAIGLQQRLPLRIQQILLDEFPINNNNDLTRQGKRGNTVLTGIQKRPTNITSTV